MAGTVLLRHDTPDGQSHYDWMIERGGFLMTFRVLERIDRPTARFEAMPLADHRREYLEYEGPVAGGRGTVTRVAAGTLEILQDESDRLRVRGTLGDAAGAFQGRAGREGRWEFTFTPEKLAEGG